MVSQDDTDGQVASLCRDCPGEQLKNQRIEKIQGMTIYQNESENKCMDIEDNANETFHGKSSGIFCFQNIRKY